MDNTSILKGVKDQKSYLYSIRKFLHENPELSVEEEETSVLLINEATRLGLTVEKVSKTGFIAILDTGKTRENYRIENRYRCPAHTRKRHEFKTSEEGCF